jgi:5-methylcytosine-specific restriction endonuclease McrA
MTKHPIVKKIENYKGYRDNYKKKTKFIQFISEDRSVSKILGIKIIRFGRNKKEGTYSPMKFNAKDLLKKIGDDPVCQLTGRPINLSDGPSYHLDHIIPKNKGGDNSLDNCQIVCREANQAKGDLLPEEFIALCKEVLLWHEEKYVRNSGL